MLQSIYLLIFFSFSFLGSAAQNYGKVIPSNIQPIAGLDEEYFYQPPNGIQLSDSLEVLIAYVNMPQATFEYIPLRKKGQRYSFSFTAKKATSIFFLVIVDARFKISDYSPLIFPKKNVLDNNSGKGYVIQLFENDSKILKNRAIEEVQLLQDAAYYMDLEKITNLALIKKYDSAYQSAPELRSGDSYLQYLQLLYSESEDSAEEKLLKYAVQMEANQKSEKDLLAAVKIYEILKMDSLQKNTENIAFTMYPEGELAKEKYWSRLYQTYSKSKLTEEIILADLNNYHLKFKDFSQNDFFYMKIIFLMFDSFKWSIGLKYEDLISSNASKAYINNSYARKIASDGYKNQMEYLSVAKLLSGKALQAIKNEKRLGTSSMTALDLTSTYYRYLETYTLILHKLNQNDSAFYYQDLMYKQNTILTAEGIENYALYSEKVKGLKYARVILEKELLNGNTSLTLLSHLQNIYKKLNVPNDEFKILLEKNRQLLKQSNIEKIVRKLGTTNAIEFKLKNILGETISLSQFRNKVIVLDFWATWCAPCKASFPYMQQLINSYKQDSNVVFLFIDIWEREEPNKIIEKVSNYLVGNNYKFNVLFDPKGETASSFKIEAIPQKVIINQYGKIVYISDDSNFLAEDLSEQIEAAKGINIY